MAATEFKAAQRQPVVPDLLQHAAALVARKMRREARYCLRSAAMPPVSTVISYPSRFPWVRKMLYKLPRTL
jgi:hypothetical protein